MRGGVNAVYDLANALSRNAEPLAYNFQRQTGAAQLYDFLVPLGHFAALLISAAISQQAWL